MRKLLSMLAVTGLLLAQRGNIDIGQIKSAQKKGNGAQLQLFGGGSTTNGHAAVYDANGNVIDGSGGSTPANGGSIQSPLVFPYTAPIVPFGLSLTVPVTVASSAVATSLIGSTYWGSSSIAGGYWLGRTVRIYASGQYGTTGSPTITIIVKIASTTVASIAPTIVTNASSNGWTLDYAFTVVSLTSVNGSGCFTGPSAGTFVGGCAGGTTTGLDFSIAQKVDITATWSASSSSNTITTYVATLSPLT